MLTCGKSNYTVFQQASLLTIFSCILINFANDGGNKCLISVPTPKNIPEFQLTPRRHDHQLFVGLMSTGGLKTTSLIFLRHHQIRKYFLQLGNLCCLYTAFWRLRQRPPLIRNWKQRTTLDWTFLTSSSKYFIIAVLFIHYYTDPKQWTLL